MGKQWKQWQTLFFGLQNHCRWCDCSHEIKRHLLLGRKSMTNLDPVQSLSRVRLFATPWTTVHQASLSITNSRSPPKPTSIVSVMPFNHLILCRPLLLLPSIFTLSGSFPMSQLFASGGQSIGVSPSTSVLPGLMSFRMDWLDLLPVQGTLKSLLQHHSSKASIFRHSAFFIVQLSHPYMTTGKTIALTMVKDLCWQSNISAF